MTSILYKKTNFSNFVNFDQFGENLYLRGFPFKVHLRKLIPAKKFILNSFVKIN